MYIYINTYVCVDMSKMEAILSASSEDAAFQAVINS